MFAYNLLRNQKKFYGVDTLEFKNCHEMPVISKAVVCSYSKESALTQRFSNFLQNSFLLEILFKQPPYFYKPQKRGKKIVFPAAKQVLRQMRLNKVLSILFSLRNIVIANSQVNSKGSCLRVSFKDPLNFPALSQLYMLFLKLNSVVFTSDFVVLKNKKAKKSLFYFFSQYFLRK